jgi:4-diphosphocytidyl-2-C-methyl-D-erythritol kinase
MTLRLGCPAKLNLHLEVWGRRGDGYHELRTLFVTVGLRDELELDDAPPGQFELEVWPAGAAPVGETNLVVRAARRLAELAGGGHGSRMKLSKRIPVAGGLAGV